MAKRHTLAAARYVERNPVRARLCARPEDLAWSSAAAHLAACDDVLVRVRPLLKLAPDWAFFVRENEEQRFNEIERGHASTGRPLCSGACIQSLERQLARSLKRKKLGPKPQQRDRYTGDLFDDAKRN